jgi:hypothetical protein
VTCPECGHEDHGRRRCVRFVAEESIVTTAEVRFDYFSSSPCNCVGPVASTDDHCDDRMVVACTLMLNTRRIPC